ncbi:thiosulfate sulfurtransferase/rhodanese-like domain-containing protein 3 [Rhinophrynus dorsalis]
MSVWLSRLCVSVRVVGGAQRSLLGLRASCTSHYTGHSASSSRVIGSRWPFIHGFSTVAAQTVQYEELKNLLKEEGVFLIDVREPWEVKEYGVIEGSLNIPMGDLAPALQMSPEDFEEKYHKKMPEKSSTLVFSCLAGIRSKKAVSVASSFGYNKVHHYSGGYEDWARHQQPEKKA